MADYEEVSSYMESFFPETSSNLLGIIFISHLLMNFLFALFPEPPGVLGLVIPSLLAPSLPSLSLNQCCLPP